MIAVLPTGSPSVLGFRASGTLHDDDYKTFVPAVDAAVRAYGKVRMLVELTDFRGWDAHALWDDTKFAATHFTAFERIAFVGNKAWEAGMAAVCAPFTGAKLKYFDSADTAAAWAWVKEAVPAVATVAISG